MPTTPYAYFTSDTSPGLLSKIDLDSFSNESTLTLDPAEEGPQVALLDSSHGFIYLGLYTDPAKIVKVRISDFTKVDTLTLDPGESWITGGAIDPVSQFAYFTMGGTPGAIAKVNLDPFSRDDVLTLAADRDDPHSPLIDLVDGYLFFSSSPASGPPLGPHFHQVDLATFLQTAELPFLDTESLEDGAAILPSATHAFLGLMDGTGVFVAKVNLASMLDEDRVQITPTPSNPMVMIMAQTMNYLLVGTQNSPGRVARLTLSPFALDSILELNPGENSLAASTFDPTTKMAYFGTETAPGLVIKVNAETLTRIAATSAGAATAMLSSAVLTTGGARIDHMPLTGLH